MKKKDFFCLLTVAVIEVLFSPTIVTVWSIIKPSNTLLRNTILFDSGVSIVFLDAVLLIEFFCLLASAISLWKIKSQVKYNNIQKIVGVSLFLFSLLPLFSILVVHIFNGAGF